MPTCLVDARLHRAGDTHFVIAVRLDLAHPRVRVLSTNHEDGCVRTLTASPEPKTSGATRDPQKKSYIHGAGPPNNDASAGTNEGSTNPNVTASAAESAPL